MSLRKLNLFIFVAAALFAVVSCKDDDDDTPSLPYLQGLYFDCPDFVSPGQAVTFVPEGVETPEGVEVSYKWKVTPTMSEYKTADVYVHWFSDTLKTYKVNATASAEGYNSASYSREVMVVKGGIDGSVTETGIKASDPKVTVDGIDYYYAKVGDLYWFRNNLANTASGTPYVNEDVTSDVFGRFYNYNEALAACPEGWRLPAEDDWMDLLEAVGSPATKKYSAVEDVASKLFVNASFNSVQILSYWPEVGDITNSAKVSLLPFGYANLGNRNAEGKYPDASFDGIFEYAVYWTADKVEDEAGMAYYRYLLGNQPEMYVGKGDVNTFGASVRCVRDAQ